MRVAKRKRKKCVFVRESQEAGRKRAAAARVEGARPAVRAAVRTVGKLAAMWRRACVEDGEGGGGRAARAAAARVEVGRERRAAQRRTGVAVWGPSVCAGDSDRAAQVRARSYEWMAEWLGGREVG